MRSRYQAPPLRSLPGAGVPVNVAAARLGHSDGGMLLLKTYAHTTDAMARDADRRPVRQIVVIA